MEVSDQIIKVLDALSEKFGVAIDWTSNNILPYVQELGDRIIKYDLCKSVFNIVLSILAIVACVVLAKSICKAKKQFETTGDENIFWEYVCGASPTFLTFLLLIVGVMLLIVSSIAIVGNFNDIIQDIILPEKTIVEFIKPYLN